MPAKIAAIVLAAGSSRRFGADNKLLATIDGQPMLARVIAAIESAGMRDLVIVTGHEADRVVAASSGPRRRHVFNPRHDQGIGTSVAAGIGALDADCAGVLIAQGDMPGLDARLVTALLQRFQDAACDVIVHPRLPDGRQGNPVVWPRRLFAALARLDGDRGAKPLIAAEAWRTATIAASEAAAGVDIDTEAALAAYLGRSAGGGEDQ